MTIPANQHAVAVATAKGTRLRSRPPRAAAKSATKTAAVHRRPGEYTIPISPPKIAKVARKSATSCVAGTRPENSGS